MGIVHRFSAPVRAGTESNNALMSSGHWVRYWNKIKYCWFHEEIDVRFHAISTAFEKKY